MKCKSPDLHTIIIVTKIKKGFLKKKERVKGLFSLFFIFIVSLFICHDLSKLNLTTVRKSLANKVVVGLLSFLIVWILDTVNMVLLFFQFKLKRDVQAARKRKFVK